MWGRSRMTKIRTNLVGHEHAWYLSLAYEIAQIIAVRKDITFPSPREHEISIDLQPGRMSRLLGKRWSILLDSSYNASPASMRMMISLITDIRQHLFPERQLLLCLWDMRELGEVSESQHKLLANEVVHADHLFLIWNEMKTSLIPELIELWYAQQRISWFSDASALWKAVDDYLEHQQELSIVLFKWSQNTIFLEEWVKQILRYSKDKVKLCRQWSWWMKKKK